MLLNGEEVETWMDRMVASGEAINVVACSREGAYYVLDAEPLMGIEYIAMGADWGRKILSIGRRKSDGVIHASHGFDLYQNPDYDCLWLR